jgi:transcriptional regulator with XRE-family HTH domain
MPPQKAVSLNDVRAKFGAALRAARARKQLTQEQLAEQSGLTAKSVGQIERGVGNPRLDSIARLAGALRIAASDLFELIDAPARDLGQPEYRIPKRELQTVAREVAESIEMRFKDFVSPPGRGRRREKR